MYPFVFLGPALALLLGQAEPAGAGGTAESPAAQQEPPDVPEPTENPTLEPPQGAARPERRSRDRAEAKRPAEPERTAEPRNRAEPERTQVARAALAFLDALVAGDASRLAAASANRFSFDGDVRSGKEEIRLAWRGFLAGRDAAQHASVLDLELLTAADAVSRLGPPPARLAPLASTRGTWVAIANVSRRPVVLFLAREGGRWAVAGME